MLQLQNALHGAERVRNRPASAHPPGEQHPLPAGHRNGERSVMSVTVRIDEIRTAAEPAILLKAREESAQRLMMAYAITGLFFMLLPGTFLGVWNLISISGGRGSAISTSWIQAHGHAQIFGWVGTFILGIGFYSIPKLTGRSAQS